MAIDFEGRVQVITSAARNAISDFKKEVEAGLDELHSLLDIESYIIRFRKKNGIDRPPELISTSEKMLRCQSSNDLGCLRGFWIG